MKTNTISAEVRLFFNTRTDWDTEYFTATCPTDMQTKAQDIAEKHGAHHFNCSMATEKDELPAGGYTRRPTRLTAGPADVKGQVAAIEESMGKSKSKV